MIKNRRVLGIFSLWIKANSPKKRKKRKEKHKVVRAKEGRRGRKIRITD